MVSPFTVRPASHPRQAPEAYPAGALHGSRRLVSAAGFRELEPANLVRDAGVQAPTALHARESLRCLHTQRSSTLSNRSCCCYAEYEGRYYSRNHGGTDKDAQLGDHPRGPLNALKWSSKGSRVSSTNLNRRLRRNSRNLRRHRFRFAWEKFLLQNTNLIETALLPQAPGFSTPAPRHQSLTITVNQA
jgi:hypothetical protein